MADKTARRPAFREAAQLIAAVADALHYAHEQGVVHRDVKPSNIMLDEQGTPRLMDFGLAKREAGEVTMTIEGQVLGTPAYMSPEQARGEAHKVDGRSDVYSLGVILYQLLTGELSFRGNQRMLLHQVLHDEPRSPSSLNDRIPRDLETISSKAMAKEPGRRYRTAGAMADDLRRYLKGELILARPVGRVEKLWRWCMRNPMMAGLTAAVCLSLALVAGVASVGYLQTRLALDREAAEHAEADRQRAAAVAAEGNARDEAERAMAAESKAKDEAEPSRRLWYAASMNLAQQAWENGQIPRMGQLLAETEGYSARGFEWYLLKRLSHLELYSLIGHRGSVTAVSWSRDGQRLATGSQDGTAKVWRAARARDLLTLRGHAGGVNSVSWSPDGQRPGSLRPAEPRGAGGAAPADYSETRRRDG